MTDSSSVVSSDSNTTIDTTKLLAETAPTTSTMSIAEQSTSSVEKSDITETEDPSLMLTQKTPTKTATITTAAEDNNEAGPSGTSVAVNNDSLFEPTVDMMVNDFDDERTLEEEEALAAAESDDPNAELSNLQREGDMPIEELLALYNCSAPVKENGDDDENEDGDDEGEDDADDIDDIEDVDEDEEEDDEDDAEDEPEVEYADNDAGFASTSTNKNSLISEHKNKKRSINNLLAGRKTNHLLPQKNSYTRSESSNSNLSLSKKRRKKNMNLTPSKKRKIIKIGDGIHDDEEDVDEDNEGEEEDDESSELRTLYPETYNKQNSSSRLLRTLSRQQSEDEEDGDYSPDEDEYKKVMNKNPSDSSSD